MKLVCPSCGAVHSAEAWTSNADMRQLVGIISGMPTSVARNVLAYIALFRPPVPETDKGYRGLSWGRALRLAGEIDRLVKETHISWKHKPARPIDAARWGMGIERVISNPPRDLPLTHHNYLRSIAYGMADDADRTAEVRRNQSERDGTLQRELAAGRAPADSPEAPLAPDVLRAIREKNMGKARK